MDSATVDFGIDLGTTNSVISRAVQGRPEVIPNSRDADLTPSAVGFAHGELVVGQEAIENCVAPITYFKRQLGTSSTYTLENGRVITPVELSAEILKELKTSVSLRYDAPLECAVVAVPAMFLQPQCEDTHKAAEMAGLQVASLLQEPIAAATAYLSDRRTDGAYLVYDLGGGTFDVSVVSLRNGAMSVVAHGGDNYLGGVDFDLALAEHVLETHEARGNDVSAFKVQGNFAKLIRMCEHARVRLSVREIYPLDLAEFGLPKLVLSRRDLENCVADLVDATIRLARQRLDQASLLSRDVKSLILVGGMTKMPYIRQRLDIDLGIPRTHDLNPMTIVANGACIAASEIIRPRPKTYSLPTEPGVRAATIDLRYDPVTTAFCPIVGGIVSSPKLFSGEIKISAADSEYTTGWLRLRDGAFATKLLVNENSTAEFDIALRDLEGAEYLPAPSGFHIRHGVAAASPVAPYNYGVVLENDGFSSIIKAGQELPAYGNGKFRLAYSVAAASPGELPIYITEGHSSVGSENVKVGELRIRGRDLTSSLNENDEVEIRMRLDENRRLKGTIYIAKRDLELPLDAVCEEVNPKVDDLADSLDEVGFDLTALNDIVSGDDKLVVSRATSDRERLEADLEHLRNRKEAGAAERIAKKIADLKAELRSVRTRNMVKIAYNDAVTALLDTERLAREVKDEAAKEQLAEIRRLIENCKSDQDASGLTNLRKGLGRMFWQMFSKTDRWWKELINYLRENRAPLKHQTQYEDYVARAAECLAREDYVGTRFFSLAAFKLLPHTESRYNRFLNAGLRR